MDVDTDRASMGWTNWDLQVNEEVKVKTEPLVFRSLRPTSGHIIELDTPSPKKRNSYSFACTAMPSETNPSQNQWQVRVDGSEVCGDQDAQASRQEEVSESEIGHSDHRPLLAFSKGQVEYQSARQSR